MSARDRAETSRKNQGLPPRINDPAVLARLAALLSPSEGDATLNTDQNYHRFAA